jgi:hypothetical protein
MAISSYYLSKHAYFCLADDHYVFLDLRSDKYLCLGRAHTYAVKDLLDGHQVVDGSSSDIQLNSTVESNRNGVIQALLQQKLLVDDVTSGKPPIPPRIEAPLAGAMADFDDPSPRIHPAHVWSFITAATLASTNLRWGSIERTVRAVERRKSVHATASRVVERGVVIGLFQIFQSLRPYYPRPYLCLFDSLALVHFLARFSVFPDWVFGVKLEPFGAHCWVQSRDLVVNDFIDNVREYTAIMIV